MVDLATLRRRLADFAPKPIAVPHKRRAAVTALVRPGTAGLELLFIVRAQVAGDPWSGHIAFPGGRVEAGDGSVRQAAEREALEEVGVDLTKGAYLGALGDLLSSSQSVLVSGFVYGIDVDVGLALNREVEGVFWRPLDYLADPGCRLQYQVPAVEGGQQVPALDVLGPDQPVLWGLTYRFVVRLLHLLGHRLPALG